MKVGLYLTYAGYLAGAVTLILAAHHLPILICGGICGICVFVGRQLENKAVSKP